MFKKLSILLSAFLLIAQIAFASPETKHIIDTTLDDSPTSITGTWNTADYNRITFFVLYDETQVGNSISAAVSLEVSVDGTNWLAGSFFDFAGGSTLQTTETISADGNYIFWLDKAMTIPYVRVTIAATNTDTDDIAAVDCYVVGQR